MIELFWDDDQGGFYFSGKDADELIVRDKELYDGAMPSGNSVASVELLRLANLTGDLQLADQVRGMHRTFKKEVEQACHGYTHFLQSLWMIEMDKKEIVIIGNPKDHQVLDVIKRLQKAFVPNYALIVTEEPSHLKGIIDYASHYHTVNDKHTIYICENGACQQPTNDLEGALHPLCI